LNITEKDIQLLRSKGITLDQVQNQLAFFRQGIPFSDLRNPATVGHGLFAYSKEQQEELAALFDTEKENLDVLKFTPASGAATRMFQFLFTFLEEYNPENETVNAYINRKNAQNLRLFFVGLDSFPFFEAVQEKLKKKYPEQELTNVDKNRCRFVRIMLGKDNLNFGDIPKGLFPFHQYKKQNSTAFEEHLYEASFYAKTKGKARLHFTISQEHEEKFKEKFNECQEFIEKKTNTSFEISYSYQKQSTDTIAVTVDNELVRNEDGNLYLRPGGHGALIENLNEQLADIIFIKNIDNVVVYKFKETAALYKKVLAGKLLQLQKQAFNFLKIIDAVALDEETVFKIVYFLQNAFSIKLASDFEKYSRKYQIEYLREQLDRPIRVCGMVKNEGEPGGGPFWVKHESGKISLQIVESVQIDPKSERQQQIKIASTHFNPVDIVCAVKNYKGEKYDLHKFVDKKAAFITHKTIQGTPIKAIEHPGLWNGAMAHWNTIFVEVPLITFNPVKNVNDLLNPAHQAER